MAQATLFPELIDHIISFLALPRKLDNLYLDLSFRWYDEKTLKPDLYSCSLVCREWSELARPHIFHTVGLRLLPDEDEPIGTLEEFLEFLDATPRVPHCIRKLELRFQGGIDAWDIPPEEDPLGIDLVLLHTVLSRLPRLHSLSLDGIHPFNSTPVDWSPTPINLQLVQYITYFYDIPLCAIFPLSLLGHVDELVVQSHRNYPGAFSYDTSQPATRGSHFALRSLKLFAYPHVRSFVEDILLTPAVDTLESLALVDFNTEESLSAAWRLLRRVGPRLLDVWIDVSSRLPTENLGAFDLSACSRLESLTIYSSLCYPTDVVNPTPSVRPYSYIRCILAYLVQVTPQHAPPCPRLRSITLSMLLWSETKMNVMKKTSAVKKAVLEVLEDIFIRFPVVETVWIKLEGTYSAGMVSVEKLWERAQPYESELVCL